MRRYGAWVAILLLTCYLVFVGGGWLGIYTATIRLISAILVGVVLVGWLVAARSRAEWRPSSVLTPAIAIALASLALSTLVSRHPRQSIEYLGYGIVLAALYLLLVRLLADPFFRARIGTLAVALAIVMGSAFLALNVAHWVTWWGLVGHLAIPPLRPESESLTYGNPSAAMTIVVLLACAAVGVLGVGGAARRAVVAIVVGLAAFATIASGSRSGWVAIAGAVIVTAGLAAWSPAGRDQLGRIVRSATSTNRGRVVGTMGLVVVAVVAAILAPTVIRRLSDTGADLRFNYLLAAGRMFLEAPILGVGPGSWVIEHVRYTQPSETLYYIPHAHNVYAQTPAELGLVGVAAGLVLLVSLLRLVLDGLRGTSAERRRWAWVAAFALLYFAGHDVLDFYANMPAILFAAAIPVAWLDATAERPVIDVRLSLPPRLRPVAAGATALLLTATVVGLAVTESPAWQDSRAVDLANDGRWAEADELAQLAVAADPGWAPYQLTMGLTAANVGDHDRAITAFRSVAGSDDLPEAWLDLAAEERLLGDDAAAAEALQQAARLGLQRPGTAMPIGALAEELGDWDLATRAYTAALAQLPSLAADPWWEAIPDRAGRLDRIVDDSIAAALPDLAWELALMAGDPDRAAALASLAPRAGFEPADVIAAWAGDDAAFRRVVDAAQEHPLDGAAVAWAGRLAGRRGDIDAQNDYLRWSYIILGNRGTEVRVSDTPLTGRTAQGGVGEFWGVYTYRRWTPWNPLVPSVVQLELR